MSNIDSVKVYLAGVISALLFLSLTFAAGVGRCEEAAEGSNDIGGFDEIRAGEASRIAAAGEIVKRSGDALKIKLENGKYKTLRDEFTGEDNENSTAYTFAGYFREIKYALAHVQYWEGDGYLMVNLKNGRTFDMVEFPNLSADKKFAAAVSASVAYNFNGIEIWRFTGNGMKKEWSYSPEGFREFRFEKWTGNNELLVSSNAGEEMRDGKNFRIRAYYSVKKGAKGWAISGPGEKFDEKIRADQ